MDKLKHLTMECEDNLISVYVLKYQREITCGGKFLHWKKLIGKKRFQKEVHVLIDIWSSPSMQFLPDINEIWNSAVNFFNAACLDC